MPQSARLTEGGGCNRYLGNAPLNLETISGGLSLKEIVTTQKEDRAKFETNPADIIFLDICVGGGGVTLTSQLDGCVYNGQTSRTEQSLPSCQNTWSANRYLRYHFQELEINVIV